MKASSRIIVNTLAQYMRTIINMVLSLYSSRLVLNILGVVDYGIYSLVAGVVSMLSFLTSSMVGSTQRFLSVSQGENNIKKLKEIFNNSLILHIILGGIVACILWALTPLIFSEVLNIPANRVVSARQLYYLVVMMVTISFIASPYRALLISHENIVYISVVDVLDGILKVVLVILLPHIQVDKLFAYGMILLLIQILNMFAYMLYAYLKYEECCSPQLRLFSFSYMRDLAGFTGWILYSSLCITVRNQGLAIVLNSIYGTTINAAYGIGAQISSMVAFVSTSLNNAMAPQLMAAEGEGDRKRMLHLAEAQSKFSFLLLAMIGIPTMFEMQEILKIWLTNVPEHTKLFACMFLSMQIVDMLSMGLSSANRAIGNIGWYTVITYTPKLLVFPIVWGLLKYGQSLMAVVFIMLLIETLCMLLRIYLFKNVSWFVYSDYLKNVVLRCLIPAIIAAIVAFVCHNSFGNGVLRFFMVYICAISVFSFISYFVVFNQHERTILKSIVKKISSK